jgi:hypothetical protein
VFSSDEISSRFYLEQQWGQQNKMSSQWQRSFLISFTGRGCGRCSRHPNPALAVGADPWRAASSTASRARRITARVSGMCASSRSRSRPGQRRSRHDPVPGARPWVAPISGAEKSHLLEFYQEYVERPNFTEVGLNIPRLGLHYRVVDRGIAHVDHSISFRTDCVDRRPRACFSFDSDEKVMRNRTPYIGL